MRRVLVFAVLSGCLQPVPPVVHPVVECKGNCPLGTCSDSCAERADAGALGAALCVVSGQSMPCSSYEEATPGGNPLALPCSAPPGSFCMTTTPGAPMGAGTFAVQCYADGGQHANDCTGFDPCDAGTRAGDCVACAPYCVR
jgi:hypothetical protein